MQTFHSQVLLKCLVDVSIQYPWKLVHFITSSFLLFCNFCSSTSCQGHNATCGDNLWILDLACDLRYTKLSNKAQEVELLPTKHRIVGSIPGFAGSCAKVSLRKTLNPKMACVCVCERKGL